MRKIMLVMAFLPLLVKNTNNGGEEKYFYASLANASISL